MNKNSIKKLVISIIFIVFLIMFFLVIKNINDSKETNKISIVKNIVKEKYDKVYFDKESNYIYTLRKDDTYSYEVFDLHGNKLYSIKSDKELDIEIVMKKYYITHDEKYHLYNSDNEEIKTGNNIEGINEFLIKVDNKIIDYNNEVIFDNVKGIKTFLDNKYLNINDNYFVDKKGKVLFDNTNIIEELNKNKLSEYLIIKKDDKYYTYFTKLGKIIGKGFDYYYHHDKNVFIKDENNIYKLYKIGLRKKIGSIPNEIDNNYIIDNRIILNNKAFAIRKKDNYYGLLNYKDKSFIKVTNSDVNSIKKIDKHHCLIETKDNNYIVNINKNKVVFKTNIKFKEIVIFDNDYKSIKNKEGYILLNQYDKQIMKLDKQIIINSKVSIGSINKDFYLYNLDNKTTNIFKKININKKVYYYSNDEVYDSNFNKLYSDFITYSKDIIIYKYKDKVLFSNKKDNKLYSYELLDKEDIFNDKSLNGLVIIEGDNYTKILNDKGNIIKRINKRNVLNYYVTNKNKVVLITGLQADDKLYQGSYLAE